MGNHSKPSICAENNLRVFFCSPSRAHFSPWHSALVVASISSCQLIFMRLLHASDDAAHESSQRFGDEDVRTQATASTDQTTHKKKELPGFIELRGRRFDRDGRHRAVRGRGKAAGLLPRCRATDAGNVWRRKREDCPSRG